MALQAPRQVGRVARAPSARGLSLLALLAVVGASGVHGSAVPPWSARSTARAVEKAGSLDTAFFSVTPCRVFDTRLPVNGPALQSNIARLIQITGSCGIPASARVLAVNVTTTGPTADGGIELFAGDATALGFQLLDFRAGQTRASNGLVRLAGDGSGTIKALLSTSATAQSSHLILDVTGYFAGVPPTVTSTNPANGTSGVPLASLVSVTFSTPVNVSSSAFMLACSTGTAPSFTVTPASPATTYVLHPASELPSDSNCTVTAVASQVTSAATGTPMAANYAFSFSTLPIANDDTYPEVVIGNVSVNSSLISFSVLTNDQFHSPVTITAFDATSANGGTVSMTTSGAGAGQFTYDPPAGYTGSDTFTYTIGNAHGSATGTVTLTVAGMIWFIDNNAGAGDGRLASPFNSLAAFQAINDGTIRHPAASHSIFLYDSTTAYSGPVTLLNGQRLIGQDATAGLAVITGLTPGTSSAALPATGGASPNSVQITSTGNTVSLGSDNTIWGLSLTNATGTALTGASVGALKIRDFGINTTGAAVSLANGALDAIIKSISAGGGAHGISLTTTTGSFDVEGDGASDPASTMKGRTTAKNGGGTLTLSSGGTIQNATGAGILLSSASNVTLRNMVVQGNGGHGIDASGSSGLTLDNVLVTGHSGNAGLYASTLAGLTIQHSQISSNATDSSLPIGSLGNVVLGQSPATGTADGLTGTASVANSIFDSSVNNFVTASHNSSTMSLTVTNSELSHADHVGLVCAADNSANISLSMTGSSIHDNGTGGVFYSGVDTSGGGTFTVKNNAFDQNGTLNGPEIHVFHQGQGTTLTFDIESNTMRQTMVPDSNIAIRINEGFSSSATTSLEGKILNNTIGNPAVADSGSANAGGISLETGSPGTLTVLITGNTVTQVGADALLVFAASSSTSTINVTASGNDFEVSPTNPATNTGVNLTAGAGTGGSDVICAHIFGNSKEIGNPMGAGIATNAAQTSTINLQGYSGTANNNGQIVAFLNTTATTVTPGAANLGNATVQAGPSACPTPP